MGLYIWVKYADDEKGNGISGNVKGKKYIGIATNKTTPNDTDNPADYIWSVVQ